MQVRGEFAPLLSLGGSRLLLLHVALRQLKKVITSTRGLNTHHSNWQLLCMFTHVDPGSRPIYRMGQAVVPDLVGIVDSHICSGHFRTDLQFVGQTGAVGHEAYLTTKSKSTSAQPPPRPDDAPPCTCHTHCLGSFHSRAAAAAGAGCVWNCGWSGGLLCRSAQVTPLFYTP